MITASCQSKSAHVLVLAYSIACPLNGTWMNLKKYKWTATKRMEVQRLAGEQLQERQG